MGATRYAYCTNCDRAIRDFNGDAVWRDGSGSSICDRPTSFRSVLHLPSTGEPRAHPDTMIGRR